MNCSIKNASSFLLLPLTKISKTSQHCCLFALCRKHVQRHDDLLKVLGTILLSSVLCAIIHDYWSMTGN